MANRERKTRLRVHPKAIVGMVCLVALVWSVHAGNPVDDSGVFAIGMAASMHLLFS